MNVEMKNKAKKQKQIIFLHYSITLSCILRSSTDWLQQLRSSTPPAILPELGSTQPPDLSPLSFPDDTFRLRAKFVHFPVSAKTNLYETQSFNISLLIFTFCWRQSCTIFQIWSNLHSTSARDNASTNCVFVQFMSSTVPTPQSARNI